MELKHGFKKMLAEANGVIETISVADAIQIHGEPGYCFVDIREGAERETGTISGSVHVPCGFLEFQADPESPMHSPAFSSGDRLALFCASGGRSALATKTLVDMGFTDVYHVAGGMVGSGRADRLINPEASMSSGSGPRVCRCRRFQGRSVRRSCVCRA
jgi:rhodanese-related sulfurtransferase